MNIIGMIEKKKNSKELTTREIQFVVHHYLNKTIPDYQMSAFLMAIRFKGMNQREIGDLTMAMAKSGEILDLSSIPGLKVDKHSTGGVGDKTTLALLPIVSAAGVPVPKISGRGLGHTGGTIDKLESISNFQTNLSKERFMKNIRKVNTAIIGASMNLAPADKMIYALRDVTGTIDSIPLIASSIMSKKIAGGADAYVLNVTVGSGAFIKKFSDAISLGKTMVSIGKKNNKNTFVIISSMDEPLGFAIGNSLEIEEVITLLHNKGPDDLKKLCLFIGSYMLMAAGITKQIEKGIQILEEVITNGMAFTKFLEIVKSQDGNIEQIKNPGLLPKSNHQEKVFAAQSGYIGKVDARLIGEASMILGAGREKKDTRIDLSVGILLKKKRGYQVKEGDVLAILFFNNKEKLNKAKKKVINAFEITERKPKNRPLILAVIDPDRIKNFI